MYRARVRVGSGVPRYTLTRQQQSKHSQLSLVVCLRSRAPTSFRGYMSCTKKYMYTYVYVHVGLRGSIDRAMRREDWDFDDHLTSSSSIRRKKRPDSPRPRPAHRSQEAFSRARDAARSTRKHTQQTADCRFDGALHRTHTRCHILLIVNLMVLEPLPICNAD